MNEQDRHRDRQGDQDDVAEVHEKLTGNLAGH
jgi:hypothetical protein